MDTKTKRRDELLREIVVLSVFTLFSAAVLAGSIKLWVEHPEVNSAGIFPTLVSTIMLCLSVYLTGKEIALYRRDARQAGEENKSGRVGRLLAQELPFRTFFTICMTILYVVGFHIIGFYIATAAFLMGTMLVFYRGKRIKQTILITAGILLGIYLIIDLLFNIPL